jgi:tryptophan synthase alpha chain
MGRIAQIFKQLKNSGKKAFIPYIMAGDPALNATKRFISELEEAGADLIELGVPFTDPLADGPTIQKAHERALAHGVTLRKVLAFVRGIRKVTDIPLILMTYYNPVFKYGITEFIRDANAAGVDGLIIPDLIPDEAGDLIDNARKHEIDTIFLLAPTSTDERIKKVTRTSTGFIYYVSITGITGAKLSMNTMMHRTLKMIKVSTNKPVAVGFGVSTPEEARRVSKIADGVIVGSAIVRLIAEGRDIKAFAKAIRNAI